MRQTSDTRLRPSCTASERPREPFLREMTWAPRIGAEFGFNDENPGKILTPERSVPAR
jgi:hypothetical protein